MMICDIAIPVWNKKELTERCVNSILSNTESPFRIILIDNGSQEPAREYLKSVSSRYPDKVKLIVNKDNLGNTAAGVQGMKYSDAEYVCILDNDTIVCKGWLSEMVKVAELSGKTGIINPNSNSFGVHKPEGKSLEDFSGELLKENSGKFIEVGAAVGFCYMVKRKVVNEIGCWDERFSPGYFEDTEYSMRAKKYGYKSVIALGAYVYHDEHSSFKSSEQKKNFEKLFNESKEKFYALYGKPKRILYAISRPVSDYKSLNELIYEHADKGDFVTLFIKKDCCSSSGFLEHGNVKKVNLKSPFFNLETFFRVILKKKKFDKIYASQKTLARFIAGEAINV
jgi:GT2 family glycosyltransferase